MSFCVAGVALRDIPMCVITCRKSFCVTGAIFSMGCIFRGRHRRLQSTLYTPHFTLHTYTAQLTFHICNPHSTLCTLHSTLYTSHSTLYTPHSTLYTPHSTLYTPHSVLYILDSTLYTRHSPLNTSLSSHSTFFTPPHSILQSLHWYGHRRRTYNAVEITCLTNVLHGINQFATSLQYSVCGRQPLAGCWMVVDGCCCSGWLSSIIDVPKHPKHRNRPC